MPRRPKGFDPLASLFEQPASDAGIDEVPLEEHESASVPAFPPVLELTDPYFSSPEEGPRAPARRLIGPSRSARSHHITSGDPDIAPPDEMPTPPPPPPPPPTPSGGLPVATGAPPPDLYEPVPDPAAVEPQPVAPVEPEPTPAIPEPIAEQPPAEPDPVALAKALARAAVAKAGPPTPSQRPPKPTAEAQPPAAPPKPRRPLSRVEALSQRAVRPKSAQDVIRRATEVAKAQERRAEERRRELKAEQSDAPKPPLVHKVQSLLERKLKGLGPLTVSNCIVLDDREVLRALWRAHRARFGAEGKLDQVVGAAAVLDAFDLVPAGKLVAAHVLTEASDYLVWLDMREGTPLAAFADARAYFVGKQTGA